jgi:hypothetical protein
MTTFVNTRQAQAWNGSVGLHWATHQQRYDALLADVNDALFAAAAVRPADRVLDVGGLPAPVRVEARRAAARRRLARHREPAGARQTRR